MQSRSRMVPLALFAASGYQRTKCLKLSSFNMATERIVSSFFGAYCAFFFFCRVIWQCRVMSVGLECSKSTIGEHFSYCGRRNGSLLLGRLFDPNWFEFLCLGVGKVVIRGYLCWEQPRIQTAQLKLWCPPATHVVLPKRNREYFLSYWLP